MATPKKNKTHDPRFFDPGKYKNWLTGLFFLPFLVFSIPASAQNQAIVTSPEYVIFRLGNDTLDTALLPAFFLHTWQSKDSVLACEQAKRCALYLHSNPHGVDNLDRAMLQAYGKGLLAYAVYYRRKETEGLSGLKN